MLLLITEQSNTDKSAVVGEFKIGRLRINLTVNRRQSEFTPGSTPRCDHWSQKDADDRPRSLKEGAFRATINKFHQRKFVCLGYAQFNKAGAHHALRDAAIKR